MLILMQLSTILSLFRSLTHTLDYEFMHKPSTQKQRERERERERITTHENETCPDGETSKKLNRPWLGGEFCLIFHNATLDDFQIERFATKTIDIALVNYDGYIFLPYFGPTG